MEQETILENITKSISDRMKVPIIVTYISVLIIYNWDIIFFLFFENIPASERIKTIKNLYGEIYYERILISLGIAIIILILFTILNTFLNLSLKWFYRKDKETNSEIENYEKISLLTEQLSELIDKNKILNTEIANLKNINENLSSKTLNINVKEISQKDFDILLSELNSQNNKEKFLYSLKELINALKIDLKIDKDDLFQLATYDHEMELLLKILSERKLIELKSTFSTRKGRHVYAFELSHSFEDFLNMEIEKNQQVLT